MPAVVANQPETAVPQFQQSQQAGILAAVAAQGFFAPKRPIWIARAPGRLDVMGGNVDYTGGMVLQGLLQEAVWVAAQPRSDDRLRILNPGAASFGWEPSLEVKMADLRDVEKLRSQCEEKAGSRWGCYVLGAVHFLVNVLGCGDRGGIDLFQLAMLCVSAKWVLLPEMTAIGVVTVPTGCAAYTAIAPGYAT